MLRRLDTAKAQQASKIYTRSALTYKVSILFGIDYNKINARYKMNHLLVGLGHKKTRNLSEFFESLVIAHKDR